MGNGQRVAMRLEVIRRFASCSVEVSAAPQTAHRRSVAGKVGITYGSVVGQGMGETIRPAQA